MNRKALEDYYRRRCRIPDNINEHLPTLRKMAEECEVVCEFGVRLARSTCALLLGVRGKVYSYDIERTESATGLEVNAGDEWTFTVADSRTVIIPVCDMLFIDSLHTYVQLKAELANAGHRVRTYLVFHDTVYCGHSDQVGSGPRLAEGTKGLMPAIEEYMEEHSEWKIKRHYLNNSGLLVLVRKGALLLR